MKLATKLLAVTLVLAVFVTARCAAASEPELQIEVYHEPRSRVLSAEEAKQHGDASRKMILEPVLRNVSRATLRLARVKRENDSAEVGQNVISEYIAIPRSLRGEELGTSSEDFRIIELAPGRAVALPTMIIYIGDGSDEERLQNLAIIYHVTEEVRERYGVWAGIVTSGTRRSVSPNRQQGRSDGVMRAP